MNELKFKDDRKEKSARSPLSQKLRFEVLKRDGFTCQYCGLHTGDGKQLEIDHITPVSKGGTNDIGNLITACKECNRGKLADEILSQYAEVKVVEKVIYKDAVPKTIDNIKPPSNNSVAVINTDLLIHMWANDDKDPELAKSCKMLLDAASNKPSREYSDAFKKFSVALAKKPVNKKFAIERVKMQKDELVRWSKQDENPLLKALCEEILSVGKD